MKDSNREAFNLWLKHYDRHEVEIDQLQRAFMWQAWQAAKAQAVPEWISVEDELPKENQFCATYFAPAESRLSTLAGHCEFGFGLSSFGCRKATHWMPLPDAPQEPAND